MNAVADALRFDPVAHTYHLGRRELISVTTALKEAGLVDDRYFTDEAAARGTAVHRMLQTCDEGHEFGTVPETLRPYFDAYRTFCEVMRPAWIHIEAPIHDATLGYAGTLDRAGVLRASNTTAVLDIKTGAVPAWVGAQTAAYRRCLPCAHQYRRFALQLKDDGTFRLTELTDRQDEKTFLAALHVAQWKRAHR